MSKIINLTDALIVIAGKGCTRKVPPGESCDVPDHILKDLRFSDEKRINRGYDPQWSFGDTVIDFDEAEEAEEE